jgi:hypothetical protein
MNNPRKKLNKIIKTKPWGIREAHLRNVAAAVGLTKSGQKIDTQAVIC